MFDCTSQIEWMFNAYAQLLIVIPWIDGDDILIVQTTDWVCGFISVV